MSRLFFVSVIFLGISLPKLAAQDSSDLPKGQVTVYFDFDSDELRPNEQAKVDSLSEFFEGCAYYGAKCHGHTDARGSLAYNRVLSRNRVLSVINRLEFNGLNRRWLVGDFYGEEQPAATNKNVKGMAKNRRVVIEFEYQMMEPPKPDQAPLPVVAEPLPDTLKTKKTRPRTDVYGSSHKRDTTIVLPGGTTLTFGLSEFLRLNSFMSYDEILDAETAANRRSSTMDQRNRPLNSCGMLRINMSGSLNDQKCFDQPVVVRYPVDEDCDRCNGVASAYQADENGRWELASGTKMKRTETEGQVYYEATIRCPNSAQNCDCPVKFKKVKMIAARGYKIDSLSLQYHCAFGLYDFKTRGDKPRRRAKGWVPEPSEMVLVEARVIGPDGQVLLLPPTAIGELPIKLANLKSGERAERPKKRKRFLGIFKRRIPTFVFPLFIPPDLLVPAAKGGKKINRYHRPTGQ